MTPPNDLVLLFALLYVFKPIVNNWNNTQLFLFLGADNDEGLVSSGRAQGSPSFMKSVFGTGWGKRAPGIGPQGQSISVDPRYSIDPGIFGPIVQGAKQVRQKIYQYRTFF